MPKRSLFIGSSLTYAFKQWYDSPDFTYNRPTDTLICHGAFWLSERMLTAKPFYMRGTEVIFPASFLALMYDQTEKLLKLDPSGDGVKTDRNLVTIDLANYDRLIFTAPMLFWYPSLNLLLKRGIGLLNRKTAELFRVNRLSQPLSENALRSFHRGMFSIAYEFLDAVKSSGASVEIWIAPAVLPGVIRSEFPDSWRPLHLLEMECISSHLSYEFGAHFMRQPEDTLDAKLATKNYFLADDHHHYNAKMVQRLKEEYDF
ncbi:MAG: hypothetical protein AAF546_12915 [Verrucomicrobiota bacterium]